MHLPHLRMRIQMSRHRQSIRIVLQHSHRQRLQPARNQKAIHRRKPRPRRPLHKINLLRIVRPRQHHRPARRVAVPVQILRHRMHHNVRPQLNRPLQIRTQKRIVHHHQRRSPLVLASFAIAAMSVMSAASDSSASRCKASSCSAASLPAPSPGPSCPQNWNSNPK